MGDASDMKLSLRNFEIGKGRQQGGAFGPKQQLATSTCGRVLFTFCGFDNVWKSRRAHSMSDRCAQEAPGIVR